MRATIPRFGFFREYLKDPAATRPPRPGKAAGSIPATWWRGDEDGDLVFVDRKKNVIRRSGENISAVEVEAVLGDHPAIRQIAVAPTPDAVRGDEVVACIVDRGSARPVEPARASPPRSWRGVSNGSPTTRHPATSSSSTPCH